MILCRKTAIFARIIHYILNKKEKAKKKEDVADKPAASQPEETVVPMREESSSIPDLDEDFGSQKSSSSLIDIEADDK